jgi:hypothetical protein
MNTLEILQNYQNLIHEKYIEHSLTSIRGLKDNFEIKGKQIYIWHEEVTRKFSFKHNYKFNYNQNIDDLIFNSDELLYFTAQLYLYRDFINNPINDSYNYSGKIIYPNLQNLYSKRYNMLIDLTFQITYNYWDRIGGLIASVFPDRIKSNKIFFPSAIDAIPSDFEKNESFLWLKNFKENEYLELNKSRKLIVHYNSSDTIFKYSHLENVTNFDKITSLQDKKESIPELFKTHISLSLIGIEKTLQFFDYLNYYYFNDTELKK